MLKRLSVFIGAAAIMAGLTSVTAWAAPTRVNSCQTITSTGSYILTRNINGSAAAGDCITIDAFFVTLDLNGFTIGGPGFIGNVPAGNGIQINAQGATIRNGTITGWNNGIASGFGQGVTVEKVRAIDNAVTGIDVGYGGIVKDSTAISNARNGISFDEGSIILDNVSRNNGDDTDAFVAYGITGTCPATVVGNSITGSETAELHLTGAGICIEEHNSTD